MAISTPGVGSGLDVNGLVNQLVSLERAPLQKLQQRAGTIQSQISSWGKLQSLVDSLRTATTRLTSPNTWGALQVSSADPATISAAVSTTGTPLQGRYAVTVGQLAQEHTLASQAIPDASDLRGRLRIELGQYDGATPAVFTPRSGSTALELEFTDAATTLEQVRDAINGAAGGVRATVLQDGTGKRLVLSSADSGRDRALRVTVDQTPTPPPGATSPTGLALLAFDGSGSSPMTQSRAAQDAQFAVNGVAMSTSGNVLDGNIPGLRMQLLKVTSAPIEVAVQSDVAGQRKLLEEFVSAYNAVNTHLANDTGFDAASRKGGLFQGDAGALSIRQRLRDALSQSSTASSNFSRLSDIGLDVQRDGSIQINATRLSNALNSGTELTRLLSSTGSGAEATRGLMTRVKALTDEITGSDGPLGTKAQSLKARLDRNQTDQERLNQRIEAMRQRLLRQYQSVDAGIARLNGLAGYVQQQFGSR